MGKHKITRRAVFLDRDGVLNRAVIRNGQPRPPFRVEDFEPTRTLRRAARGLRQQNFCSS